MFKIIFFTEEIQLGGVSRVIQLWANYFAGIEYKVHIVTLKSKKYPFLIDKKVERETLIPLNSDKFYSSLLKNLFLFLNSQFGSNIIVNKALYIYPIFVMRLLGVTKGHKLIYFIHGHFNDIFDYSLLSRIILVWTFDNFIFLGHDSLLSKTKSPRINNLISKGISKKSYFFKNPISLKNTVHQEISNSKIALFVGRLDTNKGSLMLLPIWEAILNELPNWRFIIIGEGPDFDIIKEQIIIKGLEDSVTLIGEVSDPSDFYSKAEFLIFTSKKEGLSLVLLEAVSFGLPIVSFEFKGVDELIKNNVNGYVVPYGNIEQFVHAVVLVSSNNEMKKKCMEYSKEFVSKYSVENLAKQWSPLFGEMDA